MSPGDDSRQLTNASIYAIVTSVERRIGTSPRIQNRSTIHRLGIQISEHEDESRGIHSSADFAGLLFGHDDYEIRCSHTLRRDQCGAVSREVDAKSRRRNQRFRGRGTIGPYESCGCDLYSGRDLRRARAQECCSRERAPADIAVTDEEYGSRLDALQLDSSCTPTPSVKLGSWGLAKVPDPPPPRYA